ncbi:MAG TPA: HEPN domain-containing protein [Puia sp.]|nr:HEPN domain-containing protein [Puia sp.]
MNTSLKHLSPVQREKTERAVRIIVRAVRPEKIILFGLYSGAFRSGLPACLFADDPRDALPPAMGAYDLLVVTRQGERRSDYELQDVIENRCREEVAVTALVHDIGYVNKRIAEGQCFFSVVALEGILVYDAHGEPLVDPRYPDWDQVRWMAQRDFARWDQQAKAFFRSAEFNQAEKEWKIAVFLLHQAAEQSYQAILLAFMGYKPTTHNLDKLRRYTNRFSLELALVFPRDSVEEDDLFRLLAAGYVDARYREEFIVTEEEVGVLIGRVRRLLEVAGRVCQNHFAGLEKKAAGG